MKNQESGTAGSGCLKLPAGGIVGGNCRIWQISRNDPENTQVRRVGRS
jgi:hypothetical protein